MLMSAGLELPRKVWVHGWLLDRRGERMSKSRGNLLDPNDVVAAFGTDGARYVTLREVEFDRDTEVSWDSFVRRYNADLANDFGNLVNRSVTMAGRYLGGERPAPRAAGDAPLRGPWAASARGVRGEARCAAAPRGARRAVGVRRRGQPLRGRGAAVGPRQGGEGRRRGRRRRRRGSRACSATSSRPCRLIALAAAPFTALDAPRPLAQLGPTTTPYGADGNGGPPLLASWRWGRRAGRPRHLGTPEPLFPRLETEATEPPAERRRRHCA